MDTATLVLIIEAIVAVCLALGLTVVGPLYLNTKKMLAMIQEYLTTANNAKADGIITKEESDDLVNRLCELMKQGKLVLDNVLDLKKQLEELLAKKEAKVAKGTGPG